MAWSAAFSCNCLWTNYAAGRGLFMVRCHKTELLTRQCLFRNELLAWCHVVCFSVESQCGGRAEPTMNYRSPWGAAAEQVKEKIDFIFIYFLIVLNHKLELILKTPHHNTPEPDVRDMLFFKPFKFVLSSTHVDCQFMRILQVKTVFISLTFGAL